ncbi:unnamed protein product, partial [Rotaria magnacalcarata]
LNQEVWQPCSHHKEHRGTLNITLQKLTDKCNKFLKEIEIQKKDSQKNALMKTIDEWETKSIEKIRQLAQETRKGLIPYVKNFIPRVKIQLSTLNDKVRQNPDNDEFVDTDIDDWAEELQRLETILNDPPYFTVRQDPTVFICKIYLETGGNVTNNRKKFE